MGLQSFLPPITIGMIIGFAGSMLGAVIDYINSRRKKSHVRNGSFILIIAGLVNSVAGITAIVYSIFETGNILMALALGLGVLVGFSIGFLFFAGIWIFLENKDKPV